MKRQKEWKFINGHTFVKGKHFRILKLLLKIPWNKFPTWSKEIIKFGIQKIKYPFLSCLVNFFMEVFGGLLSLKDFLFPTFLSVPPS
jgi:hypothetical protein